MNKNTVLANVDELSINYKSGDFYSMGKRKKSIELKDHFHLFYEFSQLELNFEQ